MSRTLLGVICGTVAAIAYGTNPLFSLNLYAIGLKPETVIFYRYSYALILLGITEKLAGKSLWLGWRTTAVLIGMGGLFSFSSGTLYESFLFMDAGIACSILFLYPLMVAVIMVLFFKEKASWLTFSCIAMALAGMGLLYKGNGKETLSTVGLLFVTASALSYALYIVWIWRFRLSSIPAAKLTFWILLGGTLLFFFIVCSTGLQPVPMTLSAWANTLGVAVVPTILPILFINISIKNIGPTYSAILGALEPVTALCIGVLAFHETMTPRIAAGCLLIMVAVISVTARPLLKNTNLHIIITHFHHK